VCAGLTVRQLVKAPHDPYAGTPDGSRAHIPVQSQAPRVVRVLYHDKHGVPKLARIDEEEFTAEAEKRATELELARGPLLAGSSSTLHRLLDGVFAECQGEERVKAFAGWYYGYATTYGLMRVAMTAAAAAIPTPQSSREAASEAVAAAVLEKYAAIVLRPAQTEPALRHAFETASSSAQREVLQTVGLLHARSLPLLERHTTHLDAAPSDAGGGSSLHVDWRFARGTAAGIDRAHERSTWMPSVALLGGGALVGKAVATSAGKVAATAATKAMAGKLASPFVAKVGSAMAPTAAGVGAAAGGPVGVVVGAGIGLAVDFALAKGIELAGRAELEKDVSFALRTAQGEWRYAMEMELRRAVEAILDDAVNLTVASYEEGGGVRASASAPRSTRSAPTAAVSSAPSAVSLSLGGASQLHGVE